MGGLARLSKITLDLPPHVNAFFILFIIWGKREHFFCGWKVKTVQVYIVLRAPKDDKTWAASWLTSERGHSYLTVMEKTTNPTNYLKPGERPEYYAGNKLMKMGGFVILVS